MNPAGGIVKFVESHVPHVEQAVIVDTGSVDGTAEELTQLEKKFRNLRVYHTSFENFAQARNISLNNVETSMILVLDADELIEKEDFAKLRRVILRNPNACVNFDLLNVFPDGTEYKGLIRNPRLFPKSIKPYYSIPLGLTGEHLFAGLNRQETNIVENSVFYRNPQSTKTRKSPVPIYQFKSSEKGDVIKFEQFYRFLSKDHPQREKYAWN